MYQPDVRMRRRQRAVLLRVLEKLYDLLELLR